MMICHLDTCSFVRLFDLSVDLMCIAGFDGYFKTLNPQFQKTLGYTDEELMTRSLITFMPPDDAAKAQANLARLAGGHPLTDFEARVRCKDGTYHWFAWTAQSSPKEQLIYAVGRDITERKRTEDALRSERAFLNSIIDNIPIQVFVKDAETLRFIRFNKAGEELLGFSREEMLGKGDHDFFPNEEADFFVAKDREVIDQGKLVDIPEEPIQTRYNGRRILHTQKIPIFDDQGRPRYLLGISEDITEHKEAVEALERYAEDLESARAILEDQAHQLADMVYELEAAKEKAEAATRKLEESNQRLKDNQTQLVQSEKMASLGQLAAGVAHEINNPIGFVTSNLGALTEYTHVFKRLFDAYQVLTDRLTPEQRATLQDALAPIEQICREEDMAFIRDDIDALLSESLSGMYRVTEIVKGLKSFARLDEAEMQHSDINDGITSTLKVVWNELKYKADVHTDLQPLPHTLCYPGQLNQVFMNLLINAAHAIEEHGVITITTKAVDGEVVVTVSDTGCGIPEENIPKLFNPFFTTKPVGHGTGLGLSISYGIIQKHDGRIEVTSTEGEGTTFTLYLPIKEDYHG